MRAIDPEDRRRSERLPAAWCKFGFWMGPSRPGRLASLFSHCAAGFRTAGRASRLGAVAALAVVLVGCVSPQEPSPAGSRDHLLGWFKRTGDETLIPVFKRDGIYYSVCRGFEVPLRECPEGLEWAVTPSSMTGTKIGWDAASWTNYLTVMDAQASNFTDGRYGTGEREPLRRVAKPPGLVEAEARRPHTHDDFLGLYQPVWIPGMRIEIRKEGRRYFSQDRAYRNPGLWKPSGEPREVTPLPEQLGFTGFERHSSPQLLYNEALRRFEIVMTDAKLSPSIGRMPLARVPAPASCEGGDAPQPLARIGIPSWH
jgi:hypothetical protein